MFFHAQKISTLSQKIVLTTFIATLCWTHYLRWYEMHFKIQAFHKISSVQMSKGIQINIWLKNLRWRFLKFTEKRVLDKSDHGAS